MEENAVATKKRKANILFSAIALVCVVGFIAVGLSVFNVSMSLMLFLSWLVAGVFALILRYSLGEVEGFAFDMAKSCVAPASIMLAVGVVIAAFMAAGTVPTLLVVGLELISPKVFLFITYILCIVMSTVTGTSWGTIGTVGIAMLGVGSGLGINPAITVGAIVSGAWFGDKMSPMSDSTILSAASTNTPVMDHIRHMMWTTMPAAGVAGVAYLIIGFFTGNSNYDPSKVNEIITGLQGMFHIDFWTIIPILVVIVMIILKKSTIISLLIGAIIAAFIAIVHQGFSLTDVTGFLSSGFSSANTDFAFASLLNRGGLGSMLDLVAVSIAALGLGGILSGTGLLQPLFDGLSHRIKSAKGLLVVVWVVTWIAILVVSTNYFAFAMVGTLFAPLVMKYNLKSQNLSRILEDVGTVGSVIIPWNVGAIFVVGVLGVSTMQYAPYAFLSWLVPLVSLAYILFDFKITRIKSDETSIQSDKALDTNESL